MIKTILKLVHIIEISASEEMNKTNGAILFDEWFCNGKFLLSLHIA